MEWSVGQMYHSGNSSKYFAADAFFLFRVHLFHLFREFDAGFFAHIWRCSNLYSYHGSERQVQ